jgi:GH24 family phage-related lysozyme (muramidase)
MAKYTIQVESKTLRTLATAAALGVGGAGIIVGGAKLAGVGRFADRQQLPTTPPQSAPAPIEQKAKTPEQKQTTQRVDLHPDTVDLIKNSEGFRPKAYWDKKQFSVGFGSGLHVDGKRVQKGTAVTPEQAHDMLVSHVNQRIIPKVKDLQVWNTMNDRQRGAFTSFLYNVGEHVVGSKNHPTINAAIHSNDVNKVFDAMSLYNKTTDPKGNKSVNNGLLNRREAERKYAFGEDQ